MAKRIAALLEQPAIGTTTKEVEVQPKNTIRADHQAIATRQIETAIDQRDIDNLLSRWAAKGTVEMAPLTALADAMRASLPAFATTAPKPKGQREWFSQRVRVA